MQTLQGNGDFLINFQSRSLDPKEFFLETTGITTNLLFSAQFAGRRWRQIMYISCASLQDCQPCQIPGVKWTKGSRNVKNACYKVVTYCQIGAMTLVIIQPIQCIFTRFILFLLTFSKKPFLKDTTFLNKVSCENRWIYLCCFRMTKLTSIFWNCETNKQIVIFFLYYLIMKFRVKISTYSKIALYTINIICLPSSDTKWCETIS